MRRIPDKQDAANHLNYTGSRLARLTVVRFGLVSLANEGLYFVLYWLAYRLTQNTTSTLALAGAICILVNGYTHARITFQVRFHWRLLLGYLLIQLFCFALSFAVGMIAKSAGASEFLIAFLTYTFWALCSYILSRRLFQNSPSDKSSLPSSRGLGKMQSMHSKE
jgi:putative flippase GtrA